MARFLGLGPGTDGTIDLGSYTQTWVTCSGTDGVSSLTATGTFSAGDRLFITQSRGGVNTGKYEDNRVLSYTAGTITLVHPLENDYTDSGDEQAQCTVVKEASSVTGSYTVPAWDGDVGGGFVMACNGTFDGIIDGKGKGFRGGARGFSFGENTYGQQGESISGTGAQNTLSPNDGGGGGGYIRDGINSEGTGGGGASYGTLGESGGNYIGPDLGGSPGGLYGNEALTLLFMGSGGGGGGMGDADPVTSLGAGQPGGAFFVIYANKIGSSASIDIDGVDGTDSNLDQGGGGAGSGGSGLVKSVSINPSATFTAKGGARGGGSSNGGAGGDGRIRFEACSAGPTTDPVASESTGGHTYCGGSAYLL